jgi:hypothetical protein
VSEPINSIEVSLEIPGDIQQGLNAGAYERVGSIIRNPQTKQIVAWLRELNSQASPADFTGLANSLNLGASLLNLGITGIGFTLILQRLNILEKRLQSVEKTLEQINQKIDWAFYAKFQTALDLASNAFRMQQPENRRNSAMQAIDRLLEIEHYYTACLRNAIQQQSEAAANYLLLLFLAYVAEARCYLELEEIANAEHRLQTGLNTLRPYTKQCIHILLTPNPAVYLHPNLIGKVDLQRLTKVYQHLDPTLDESAVFEAQRQNLFAIAQQMPRDQTDLTMTVAKNFFKSFSLSQTTQDLMAQFTIYERLPVWMQTMEELIEASQRFSAYHTELQAIAQLQISFQAWSQLTPVSASPGQSQLLYLIPSEPFQIA